MASSQLNRRPTSPAREMRAHPCVFSHNDSCPFHCFSDGREKGMKNKRRNKQSTKPLKYAPDYLYFFLLERPGEE